MAEQQRAGLELLHARLRIEVEVADALQLVAEKFQTHGQRVLEAEHIHDAAAHRELPALRHLRHALVARVREAREERVAPGCVAARESHFERTHLLGIRHRLIERRACDDDDFRGPLLLSRVFWRDFSGGALTCASGILRVREPLEDRQTLGDDFGIGQRAFDRRDFHLGKKERVRVPLDQLVVKLLLCAQCRAHEPQPPPVFPRRAGKHGAQRGVRAFLDVFERDTFTLRRGTQLRRERGLACECVEQIWSAGRHVGGEGMRSARPRQLISAGARHPPRTAAATTFPSHAHPRD